MNVLSEKIHPTPEQVLAFLKVDHEILVDCEEAEEIEITFDTTVYDWFWIGDEFCRIWISNARRLNELFQINATMQEWKAVLTPAKKRTVRDICEFLAQRAKIHCIPEPMILGRPCRAAGVFLTVKKIMDDAGVDTHHLMPSTALMDYADTGLPKIIRTLINISPSLQRHLRYSYHSDAIYMLIGIILFFATIAATVITIDSSIAYFPMVLLSFLGFISVWHVSSKQTTNPISIKFEGLYNFRDLCYAMI